MVLLEELGYYMDIQGYPVAVAACDLMFSIKVG